MILKNTAINKVSYVSLLRDFLEFSVCFYGRIHCEYSTDRALNNVILSSYISSRKSFLRLV